MLKTDQDIIDFVESDEFMMRALTIADSLGLKDWFIGAGFVRDSVWNIQHGYDANYDYKDLDLAYFDTNSISEEADERLSKSLSAETGLKWEIVNQGYAHKYNGVPAYLSAIDGLAHWVETATSVAVTLDDNGRVALITPWGCDDLLNLKLRLVPCHEGNKYYEKIFIDRVNNKKWLERWPKLQIIN